MADDPYLWLEDIQGTDALDWVNKHNEPTVQRLVGERFEVLRADALEVFNADTRIPMVARTGDYLYNFWRDARNPRGVWRRTTLDEYRKDSPDWDVIIDVDALSAAEDDNWQWGGAAVIEPERTRALVALSRGGGDATEIREFDMATREFIPDGFTVPEAKSDIDWETEDSVLLATDYGEGSMTESGYPRIIKRWRRGTPLDAAETIFAGAESDVSVVVACAREPGFERTFIYRSTDFYNQEAFELRGGELLRIDIPTDAKFAAHRQWMMILLLSEWTRGEAHLRARFSTHRGLRTAPGRYCGTAGGVRTRWGRLLRSRRVRR